MDSEVVQVHAVGVILRSFTVCQRRLRKDFEASQLAPRPLTLPQTNMQSQKGASPKLHKGKPFSIFRALTASSLWDLFMKGRFGVLWPVLYGPV